MFKIIDTSPKIFTAYDNCEFNLDQWKEYIDQEAPYLKVICLSDMKESIAPEYSWDSHFLPVLNAVVSKKENVEKTSEIFRMITEGLENKIINRFCKSFDVDIILYLGLCNGAGWVTDIAGKTAILLGIEKILELKWDNIDDMNGLILHELGHVYQEKFGVLAREFDDSSDQFLWQLFTEGIAMVFEQEIMNDCNYYHQDRNGWQEWCNQNIKTIATDFVTDYKTMTRTNQRYFGDWAKYKNHSDVGYYLGTRFVRFILERDMFDSIILHEIDDVKRLFDEFSK